MAYQFSTGTVPANLVSAMNLAHAALWAGTGSHYDLAEVNPAGEEQVPAGAAYYPSTITDMSTACNAVNRCKALFNDHLTRHNSGSGAKIYAHKVVDTANAIATADMSDGATYDAALLATLITLTNELRTDYEAHRSDGVTSHHAVDTGAMLGGLPTISTWAELASELNNLKAQYNAHKAKDSSGGIHDNADGGNTVSAANASSTDPDSCLTLANAIRTAYEGHRVAATVHFTNDTTNTISTSAAGYPAGLFTLPNAVKAAYETHRASTTYHEAADSTNTISAANATTVATLIALAEELRTDVTAHFRKGPASAAVRSL